MTNRILPLVAGALAFFQVSKASAQCDFDVAPAKGLKASMVRSFAACPGTDHPTGNTSTEGGIEACTPVVPRSVGSSPTLYSFGEKGKCDVRTSSKLVKDCSGLTNAAGTPLGLQAGPCHVTFVNSKCSGILGTDGQTLIGASDDGFSLATLTRATMDDASGGDMTVIDFPVTFTYSVPSNGKMSVDSSSAESLVPLVGVNNAGLPSCTSIEFVDVVVKDPQGMPFAVLGAATIP